MRWGRYIHATIYLAIAAIAAWGGIQALSPRAVGPTWANPNPNSPVPLVVNSAMVTEAIFYFVTSVVFLGIFIFTARILRKRKINIDENAYCLNLGFSGFLFIVSLYLIWHGGRLLALGGSPYFLLVGLALMCVVALLIARKMGAALLYALIVLGTVLWTLYETELDFYVTLSRLAAWLVVGLWFVTPWYRATLKVNENNNVVSQERWVVYASLSGVLLLLVSAINPYPTPESGTNNALPLNAKAVADWQYFGGGPEGQRFAQIDQINVSNVHLLKEAWRARTGVSYDFKQTPQVVNGIVYICTAASHLIAYDSDSGEERWRYDTETKILGGIENVSSMHRTCRGVGYYEADAEYMGECARRIFAGTVDGRLIAVDAMSGQVCRSFGNDGIVNLYDGLGPEAEGRYWFNGAPLVADNKVVVGGPVADNQRLGNPSGVIRAYDAITGEFAWAWDLGNPGYHGWPDGGEFTPGTPNSWGVSSYDPHLNLIYAPTGNASPDYFDGDLRSKETEENASAVVAIDAATGERRWVYQTVHRDVWDWDVASQPVLVDIRKNNEGELIPAVAVPTKRSEIFLLDRRTGEPIYDTPELPVPQDPVEGEILSPTQPFSSLPHFRPERRERDIWGLTPIDQLFCRIEYKKMRYDGHFTPPVEGGGGYGKSRDTWGGTLQSPGNAGGFNWGSVAVDADNGLLIGAPLILDNRIVQQRRAVWLTERGRQELETDVMHGSLIEAEVDQITEIEQQQKERFFDQSRVKYLASTDPFLSTWKLPLPFFNVPTNIPCFKPPYSVIGVIDLNTNKLLWKRPLGSMKDMGPFGIPTRLPLTIGTPVQAGVLATRGGLAFHAGTMDSTIRAFDIRTGKVKWKAALPQGGQATPMSYAGKNGKQYILVTVPHVAWKYPLAGWTKPLDDKGGYVIAYALPD